jgi:hypothetical protein
MIDASAINYAISGGLLVGYWAIGLFFFRFRKQNGDRFFGFFGCAFWLLALERLVLLLVTANEEVKPYVYIMRLVAFSFIIYAIYDKNRATTAPPKSNPPA